MLAARRGAVSRLLAERLEELIREGELSGRAAGPSAAGGRLGPGWTPPPRDELHER